MDIKNNPSGIRYFPLTPTGYCSSVGGGNNILIFGPSNSQYGANYSIKMKVSNDYNSGHNSADIVGSYTLYGNGWTPAPDDTSTRIESVTPSNGSTVATGTVSFIVEGYISPDDYNDDMYIDIRTTNNNIDDINPNVNYATGPLLGSEILGNNMGRHFMLDIATSGPFSVLATSTYSESEIGIQYMDTKIYSPYFNLFGFGFGTSALISTSTTFTVATTSYIDDVIAGIASSTKPQNTVSRCDALYSTSTPITLSDLPLGQAVYCFIMPTKAGMKQIGSTIYQDIFKRAPLGFITRLYEIGFSNATSSLPILDYTFPTFVPIIGGYEWTIDPWTELSDPTKNPFYWNDLDYGDPELAGKSIWDIMGDYYDVVIYCLYVIAAGWLVYKRYFAK